MTVKRGQTHGKDELIECIHTTIENPLQALRLA